MPDKEAKTTKEKAKPKSDTKRYDGPPAPPQPDNNYYQELIQAKSQEISRIQSQMNRIKEELQAKSGEKNEYHQAKNALSAEIQAYAEQIRQVKQRKAELREDMNKKSEEKKDMWKQLDKMKGQSLMSEEDIDAAIAKIEFEMSTSTVTLMEEKRKMQDIQNLKKKKLTVAATAAKVKELEEKSDQMKMDQNVSANEHLKALKDRANEAWEKKEAVRAQREKLSNDFRTKHSGIAEMEEQLVKLRAQSQTLVSEKNKVRDEWREAENAYWRWEQEMKKLKQEQHNADRLKMKQEWEAKKLERDEERLTVQPHLAEITALEQSILFLKALLPSEAAAEEKKTEHALDTPEGTVVLLSKKDRDAEMYFMPSKKKGPHKKQKQAVKSTVIRHNAETFRMFDALKVKAPSSTDQIPETLKELEEQLAKYNERVAEWKRKLNDGTLHKEFYEKKRIEKRPSYNEEVAA